jgi:hypothetical protein
MRLTADGALARVATADHGILATLRRGHAPDLVPACYALEDEVLAIPIDLVKPKASTGLQRERNLAADRRATFLVEGWDPIDWSKLWWVRLRLEQSTEEPGAVARLETRLRERYPQYGARPFAAVLKFRITSFTGWRAGPPA